MKINETIVLGILRSVVAIAVLFALTACAASTPQVMPSATATQTAMVVVAPSDTPAPTATINPTAISSPTPRPTSTVTASPNPTSAPSVTPKLAQPAQSPTPAQADQSPTPSSTQPAGPLGSPTQRPANPPSALDSTLEPPPDSGSCGKYPCADDIAGWEQRIYLPGGFCVNIVVTVMGRTQSVPYAPNRRMDV